MTEIVLNFKLTVDLGFTISFLNGGLAQMARAPALHAGGHGFESHSLHHLKLMMQHDP